jgi:probable HAF family extracellular repeat protein
LQVLPPDIPDEYVPSSGASGYAAIQILDDEPLSNEQFTLVDLGTANGPSQALALHPWYDGTVGYSSMAYSGDCRGTAKMRHPYYWSGGIGSDLWGGGSSSDPDFYPLGINYYGDVVGYLWYPCTSQALPFLREGSPSYTWVWLGELSPAGATRATGINEDGDIVGFSRNSSGVNRAVVWLAGSTTPTESGNLGPSFNPSVASEAYWIKGDRVVGKSKSGTTGPYHGFRSNPLGPQQA